MVYMKLKNPISLLVGRKMTFTVRSLMLIWSTLLILSHAKISMWSSESDVTLGSRSILNFKNDRLQRFVASSSEKTHLMFTFNTSEFLGSFNKGLQRSQEDEDIILSFSLPGFHIEHECKVVVNAVDVLVPEDLWNEFPTLKMIKCFNGGLQAKFLMNSNTSFMSGNIVLKTKSEGESSKNVYYIDQVNDKQDSFVIYDRKAMSRSGPSVILDLETEAEHNIKSRRLMNIGNRAASSMNAYTLRIAVGANYEYSDYHGGTKDSVLVALITAFDRVNGIYGDELGVFFQFVDGISDSICLSASPDSSCTNFLPNKDASTVLNKAAIFFANKGIPIITYDIGHIVTTGTGGLATLNALCTSERAEGTTGLSAPEGDVFYVDYLSHELGHQLGAFHSYRDCSGPDDSQLSADDAVEPGSGSTIMGYAGICGGNNIQSRSEPYFHASSLERISEFLASRTGACGTKRTIGDTLPTLSTLASCNVPVGNAFQLNANTNSHDLNNPQFFNWETSDAVYEDYSNKTIGRFRSWNPTSLKQRFFPNLYYLNNLDPGQIVEILPSVAKSMTFKFSERDLYNTSATLAEFGISSMGYFITATTTVNFKAFQRLAITSNAAVIQSGEPLTVTWQGDSSLTSRVELLMAINPFTKQSTFDYELHNQALNWTSLGTADVTAGKITVQLPVWSRKETFPVNLMLKSVPADERCYFFDYQSGISLREQPSPTVAPTLSPTRSPTRFPTLSPTHSPTTSRPTRSPTSRPTVSPTEAPTHFPTKSPSHKPTKSPSKSPTPQPTTFPTSFPTTPAPTLFPTTGAPTEFPTDAPTGFPTEPPTTFPTQFPTVTGDTKFPTESPSHRPTLSPTDFPTQFPTSSPSKSPTHFPTTSPSKSPTHFPTKSPSTRPTKSPTTRPTKSPIDYPTFFPTLDPSESPTTSSPTSNPTFTDLLVGTSSRNYALYGISGGVLLIVLSVVSIVLIILVRRRKVARHLKHPKSSDENKFVMPSLNENEEFISANNHKSLREMFRERTLPPLPDAAPFDNYGLVPKIPHDEPKLFDKNRVSVEFEGQSENDMDATSALTFRTHGSSHDFDDVSV